MFNSIHLLPILLLLFFVAAGEAIVYDGPSLPKAQFLHSSVLLTGLACILALALG